MKRDPWSVAVEVTKANPLVVVFVEDGGYKVYPAHASLSDVQPLFYEKAVYLRRALPGIVSGWNQELVRRSQLELSL